MMTVMDGLNFGLGFVLAIVTSVTTITLLLACVMFLGRRD